MLAYSASLCSLYFVFDSYLHKFEDALQKEERNRNKIPQRTTKLFFTVSGYNRSKRLAKILTYDLVLDTIGNEKDTSQPSTLRRVPKKY